MSGGGKFSRLPAAAISDNRVSHASLRVLAALCVYVKPDGTCFPSVATLAKRIGLTRAGAQYHIRRLEKLGYVTVWRKKRHDGMNQANHYQVSYIDIEKLPQEHRLVAVKRPRKGSKPKADQGASPTLAIVPVNALALTAQGNSPC